jgi:hypothetical protein
MKKNKNILCRVSVSKNDTRHSMLCRVSDMGHSAKRLLCRLSKPGARQSFFKNIKLFFVECLSVGTRQCVFLNLKKSLPSARSWALGKVCLHRQKSTFFTSFFLLFSTPPLPPAHRRRRRSIAGHPPPPPEHRHPPSRPTVPPAPAWPTPVFRRGIPATRSTPPAAPAILSSTALALAIPLVPSSWSSLSSPAPAIPLAGAPLRYTLHCLGLYDLVNICMRR